MNDYLKAYRERLERNHNDLLNLAKDVVAANPKVEVYGSANKNLYSGLVFILGQKINSVSFHEVPYRWSGCGYGEFKNSNYSSRMPFIAEEVLNTMKDISTVNKTVNEKFTNKNEYLIWCSYLKMVDLAAAEK